MEVKKEEELADNVEEAGNALLSRPDPSSVYQLLLLLETQEVFISHHPIMCRRHCVLLNNLNVDVKVSVASCICEIMRSTAPDAPCGDEQMKKLRGMTMEVKKEEELADNVEAAGNALLSRPDPSSVYQLLLLLGVIVNSIL
ncbi:conserved hypothetical protein [Ricinus communis]|uniref:Uncharacterized protein n=1 Tax=Ricinus communis TaxID=3988 RepID=B9T9F1_RICCO|nr:conserved hypothetical protein [Ricinus communis]